MSFSITIVPADIRLDDNVNKYNECQLLHTFFLQVATLKVLIRFPAKPSENTELAPSTVLVLIRDTELVCQW